MESVIATREEIERFLSVPTIVVDCSDIYGNGYGDGYGCGSGHGYEDGYGNGYGNGNGYGDGPGYGYRNGEGYGFGYGTGCGSDDCYGFGSGIGYGIGEGFGSGYYQFGSGYYQNIKALNGNIVDYVDSLPTIITQVRDNIACGYIVKSDLTLDSCYIAKSGSSFAHGYTLKEAVEYAEAKEMENMPIEERIKKFIELFGSLGTEHIGKEFYDWHHILTGSCRIGRDKFCEFHDIDLEKKYTVKYFLDITDESYGGDIIKLIRKAYKEIEE